MTLSSKVNPTLQKPWMLIRLNVSVPYFSTIGVTAASPLLLFPRNAVSYPYLDSRSLHRRQPRRPSPDKCSLVSNYCTDVTHCRTMFGVTLLPLPRCTRRSSRAPGSPSIQIFHAQRCERRTVGMEYGYEIHCCRPAVHMCLASTRVRAGYGSKTILESLGNSQVVKVLIFCSERRWSPRDPVLLLFIFHLYLEEYCILNSGGHFGFSIYTPQDSYQVPGVQFSHLTPSLSVLISLRTSTLDQRAIPLTSSYPHNRYEEQECSRVTLSMGILKQEPWLKMAVKNLTQRIPILRWMQLYRKILCIVSGSFLLIRRKATWCKP